MTSAEAFAPLRDRRFAWFLVGRLISTGGSVMAPVALAFAVLGITDSAIALGQVLAARSIPLILLLLVGGVVADRLPRSTVLLASHLASFGTQGIAAYLVITGRAQLWQIVALEIANGAMTAFTMPAIQGLVPQVVDRRYMQQANALLAFTRSGLAVLGPALAGVLVVTVGPGWALALDALSWLLAAGCMLFVRVGRGSAGSGTSLLSEMRAGWGVFRSITWLWVVVIACGVLNAVYGGAWSTLGPVVAKARGDLGEQDWGLAVSAEAVGLLICTVVMLHARVRRPLLVGMLSMLALALPLLALAFDAAAPVLYAAAMLGGAGVQAFMISWQTAIHEHVPERYMSRVSAYDAVGSFAAVPVGQIGAGVVAGVIGMRGALVGSALVFVIVVVATLAVPAVRGLGRTEHGVGLDELAGPDAVPDGIGVVGGGRPTDAEAGA